MRAKKYAKNLTEYLYEEDKREKLTVSISSENKKKIKQMKINSSKLIDDFLTDFFAEIEKQRQQDQRREKPQPTSSPTAQSPGLPIGD